jgi:hypothetical protein
MNTPHNLKRIIAGALLSGGVAVAGLGLASGTAHAFDPQPDPPGKPINGQPEAPGRPITIAVNPQSKWRAFKSPRVPGTLAMAQA